MQSGKRKRRFEQDPYILQGGSPGYESSVSKHSHCTRWRSFGFG